MTLVNVYSTYLNSNRNEVSIINTIYISGQESYNANIIYFFYLFDSFTYFVITIWLFIYTEIILYIELYIEIKSFKMLQYK